MRALRGLVSLPASLSSDADSLDLRRSLVERHIAVEFPETEDRHLVGEALLAALETVDDYTAIAGHASQIGLPLSFADHKASIARQFAGSSIDSGSPYTEGYDVSIHQGRPLVAAEADSFAGAAHEVVGWIEYGGSGSYESSMETIRGMYYVFVAEHYSVPYWPSVSLLPIARRFPNYLSPSTRSQIYGQMSRVLKGTVEEIAQEFEGSPTFVPPFSAVVLDRARRPEEIPEVLLSLRDEYAGFRREMRDLELQRREARSVKDRLRVMDQVRFLCEEVSRPFSRPAPMKLESTLRIVPEMTELALNPTSPTTWVKTLLDRPAEALLRWYRRRPVGMLLKSAHQVSSMREYDNLLQKHFGHDATSALRDHSPELARLDQ